MAEMNYNKINLERLCANMKLTKRETRQTIRIYQHSRDKYVINNIHRGMTSEQCISAWNAAKTKAYHNAQVYIRMKVDQWHTKPLGIIERIRQYLERDEEDHQADGIK